VQRKAQLSTPGQPAGRWSNAPDYAFPFEDAAIVPVSNKHLLDTDFVKYCYLATSVRFIHNPIWLGIGESSVAKNRHMLNSDQWPTSLRFLIAQPREHFVPFCLGF
jgi:hypothetical protein